MDLNLLLEDGKLAGQGDNCVHENFGEPGEGNPLKLHNRQQL